jgi:benzoate-CoA ligase family protein
MILNAAAWFVDRHLDEGRAESIAIEGGDRRLTYRDLQEQVNRAGSALRNELGVRPEERVVLLMLDGPEMIAAFFGAIKIGAVPIPLNTRWTAHEYEYVLRDCGARVIILSGSLHAEAIKAIRVCPSVRHVVAAGEYVDDARAIRFETLIAESSPVLEPEPTSRDAPAFWLYSSGTTGRPKGCVHLQHDMGVCAENYARGVLGIHQGDRCFSVAKLFFAYGLGNSMYFPFSVGATSILWPGAVTPPLVFDIIERCRPTLFFSVPTHYAMLLAHTAPDREFDLSSVRCAVSAGEALPPALFHRFRERFGVEILDGIGSTEVLHIFISNQPGRARPGSSGVPVPGYEARLVD